MKTKIEIDSELKDLIPKFVETLKHDIANMESYLNARDFESLTHTSHRLRGDAASYGFVRLGEICGQLEDFSRDGELKSCEKLLEELKKYFANIEIVFISS